MPYDPEKHHRRSIRLSGYDYTSAGMYFVTICTAGRVCVFGDIVDEGVRLSRWGRIAARYWRAIPDHFPAVDLDAFVIMPNHVHGIMVINKADGGCRITDVCNAHGAQNPRDAAALEPSNLTTHGVPPRSLSAIVRSYKAGVTREINRQRHTPGTRFWQRNYSEHVVRNREDYERVYTYAVSNPGLWLEDRLYAQIYDGVVFD